MMGNKGFSYTLDDEKIIEYMKLTVEEKLQWLEEIIELTESTLTEKEKEFRRRLMDGTI